MYIYSAALIQIIYVKNKKKNFISVFQLQKQHTSYSLTAEIRNQNHSILPQTPGFSKNSKMLKN